MSSLIDQLSLDFPTGVASID